MRAALYARVSTGRQERDQTIDSQLTAIRQWATDQGHELRSEHLFTDEGYSGSRLDRPGLDRLRDAAREGEFDVLAVFSPDRLARKYAYQVLLLEELRKAGCEVVFVQRPISEDPHDQLLLQIQGAIAEYERAVLGERFRRGKLQKARAGQWTAGKPPYGYRYIPKHDGSPGYLVINEAEVEVVRMLYRWLIEERMTVRQILKRLAAGPWRPRCGRRLWSNAVVHRVLSDPVYTGTAYANRYTFHVPRRPRARGPRSDERTCRRPRPREEWIPIPVPAIIDEPTHQQALAQLARNAVLSFRNNRRNDYLLRCLLTCKSCGLAMFGITQHATENRPQYRYYQCHGKDCVARDRDQRCPRRPVKADELEAAVWKHVQELLNDPATLLEQFEALARQADAQKINEKAEEHKWEAQLRRLDREEQRLLDAYQAEVIDLEELKNRRQQLAGRRQALTAQQAQQARLQAERQTAQEVWEDLKAFCERVRGRLDEATLAEKQQLLQLLIERVIVGEDAGDPPRDSATPAEA
jgi:site-specific DNA recombinase